MAEVSRGLVLLSVSFASFVLACVAFIVDAQTSGIGTYLKEHPTPLTPPPWVFAPWVWVPIMLNHGMVYRLMFGRTRTFEMPREELRRLFMAEYGEWWTLGFASESFVALFLSAGASLLPPGFSGACIAVAAVEATFCFMWTSLSDKAYAVMASMSTAQADGGHPFYESSFAPNYSAMVGVCEMVGTVHAALLTAATPAAILAAFSTPLDDPGARQSYPILAWVLFAAMLLLGLVTTFKGNCIFGVLLFYCMCWMPILGTLQKGAKKHVDEEDLPSPYRWHHGLTLGGGNLDHDDSSGTFLAEEASEPFGFFGFGKAWHAGAMDVHTDGHVPSTRSIVITTVMLIVVVAFELRIRQRRKKALWRVVTANRVPHDLLEDVPESPREGTQPPHHATTPSGSSVMDRLLSSGTQDSVAGELERADSNV